jgi:phospholipid/cholesterol/gamma-HCH transport system substrate-binding protein
MAKERMTSLKLGLFVITGLVLLIVTLYFLGKNKNLFGSTFQLRAQFENVNGLRAGNNVRFSGIEVGTVKKVVILSDSVIEVYLALDSKVKKFIMKNAEVSIGTDGLVGNKVLNIVSVNGGSEPVEEGDLLTTKKATDIEEMLNTLGNTNENISIVSEELKRSVQRINSSRSLWSVLDDSTLSPAIRHSVFNIRIASERVKEFSIDLGKLMGDVKAGKGSVGRLIADTGFIQNLDEAVEKIKLVGENANELTGRLNSLAENIKDDYENKKGTLDLVLRDTAFAASLNRSMENIKNASDKLDQNMEALKHNFLFRGYFRRLERKNKE